jgi:hypothetical protein
VRSSQPSAHSPQPHSRLNQSSVHFLQSSRCRRCRHRDNPDPNVCHRRYIATPTRRLLPSPKGIGQGLLHWFWTPVHPPPDTTSTGLPLPFLFFCRHLCMIQERRPLAQFYGWCYFTCTCDNRCVAFASLHGSWILRGAYWKKCDWDCCSFCSEHCARVLRGSS